MRSSTEDSSPQTSQSDAEIVVKLPAPKDGALSSGEPAQLLADVPSERHITVAWKDVDAAVPTFNANKSFVDSLKALVPKRPTGTGAVTKKQILYGCKGIVRPGEVMALMGPSGSGKTSLVSTIGDRNAHTVSVTGTIHYNGRPLTREIKRNVGFVLQDDLLFDSLTVEETLLYAARLRLSRDMPLHEKRERVDAVIAALGLQKCRGTLVGGPTRRGISGGERKRVSVGHELLIDPSVLILDEPTSGLDSTTAMHLMSTLRALASGGRTVITTIHQPSSRLYQQLDNLILMSDGHVMYSGLAREAASWFGHLGCMLPYGTNVADFVLDLASGEFEDDRPVQGATGSDRKHRLVEVCEEFMQTHEDGFQGEADVPHIHGVCTDGSHREASAPRQVIDKVQGNAFKEQSHARSGATYLEQLRVLFARALKTRRFEALGLQRALQNTGAGLVAGLLWWQRGSDSSLLGASDAAALLFFEMLFLSFGMMFASLFTLPTELRMLLKEKSSAMYQLSAYYVSKTFATLPVDLLYPSIFVFIVYWFGGLRAEFVAFVGNFFTIMLGILNAQTFGLLIGLSLENFQKAQTVATVTILTFMLASGFWIQAVPSFISWVKFASFVYWTYSAVLKLQFRDRTYWDCNLRDADPTNDIADRVDCTRVTDVSETLDLPRHVNESPLIEYGVLLLMLVVLRYVVYLVLVWKTRRV